MSIVYFLIGAYILFRILRSALRFFALSSALKERKRKQEEASLHRTLGVGAGLAILGYLFRSGLTRFTPVLTLLPLLLPLLEKHLNRNTSQGTDAPPKTGMDREEARQILGVDPAASKQDIQEAYKRLMLRNHPDGGGTDYLAAKINQARDVLLKR